MLAADMLRRGHHRQAALTQHLNFASVVAYYPSLYVLSRLKPEEQASASCGGENKGAGNFTAADFLQELLTVRTIYVDSYDAAHRAKDDADVRRRHCLPLGCDVVEGGHPRLPCFPAAQGSFAWGLACLPMKSVNATMVRWAQGKGCPTSVQIAKRGVEGRPGAVHHRPLFVGNKHCTA
jgi:hypothetical protein